jgi:hypothetical protein
MTTIHTGNTVSTGFSVASDVSGDLVLKTGGSGGTTAATISGTNQQATFVNPISQPGGFSFRNKIINGNFNIWQRGTSITAGADTYTADRWAARESVVSQSTDVPANQGFNYSLFYDNGGVRTDINLRQKIEDGKILLRNRAVTLSFWLKSSIATSISVDWTDTNTTTVPVTTTWQRYEVTFPAADINPNDIFSGSAWVDFNFGNSYPDIHITGVQLEEGSTATPFERRPYGTELSLCQRYFYRWSSAAAAFQPLANGTVISSTEIDAVFFLPVTMRATPTATFSASSTFLAENGTSLSSATLAFIDAYPTGGCIRASGLSGLTVNQSRKIRANNSTAAFVAFNAEL